MQVVEHGERSVVEQTVGGCVVSEAAAAVSREAAVISADPESAIVIFLDGSHPVAGQTVGLSQRCEFPVLQVTESAVSAKPQIAERVFVNALDVISGKAVG